MYNDIIYYTMCILYMSVIRKHTVQDKLKNSFKKKKEIYCISHSKISDQS